MDSRNLKTIKFNLDIGTLLSLDFSSCSKGNDSFDLTEEIIDEILECVQNKGFPDLIWFKGIGNSIQSSHFNKIIDMIREVYPNQKIGIYLNCGIFQDEEIRNDFYECNLVAINLNSVDSTNFSKINKCPESINRIAVLEGIKEFRKNFIGKMGIYTMFLSGINDTIENVKNLKDFLLKVIPDYYSISNYTLDGFNPVSIEFKKDLKDMLKDVPFKVIFML
jgi:wyosine [tRNA(Phe)-imidazoG37] synthetase (radical SAM superfamily)